MKLHSRLAYRMNVKNETARILRAHAERAVSANVLVKIYFKLYRESKLISEDDSYIGRLN